ncbi:MAG: YncE family protein [Pseudonocardia sp.]|nr:YncE family protein [Pseudonocardia sp.]
MKAKKKPIGLPTSWGFVIVGASLVINGFLLTKIPNVSTLVDLLLLVGFILLVVGTVAVVRGVRDRSGKGHNATEQQARGHMGLLDRRSLGQLIRRQPAFTTSVILGVIPLVVVLVVVNIRPFGASLVTTISGGTSPWNVAVSPDGRHAYVTNYNSNDLSVIDTVSNVVVITIPVGTNPWKVAVTLDGGHAYIANYGSNNVSVIDTSSNAVTATIPVGDHPEATTVTPDGRHAYVTNSVSNNVSVIDTLSNAVTGTIAVGIGPGGVAVAPDGRHAYVTNYNSDNVSVIDVGTNAVTATIPVGTNPWEVVMAPDGRHAYVTNYSSNSVSIIDLGSNTVTATIALGLGTAPEGEAVTPDGVHVYVANNNSNNVSVIDTLSNAVTDTIAVGTSPGGVAVAPDGRYVYVPNSGSNNVSVIEIAAGSAFPAGLERFYRQNLAWNGCIPFATTPEDKNTYADPGLQCAYLEVPLDYAHPYDRTVKIGLLRRPASDRTHRIGSLVINPGGPGDSGMSAAVRMVNQVTNNDLGRRFDLVGFDPRGIGSSKPRILCRTPVEQDAERLMNSGVDTSPAGVVQTENQEKSMTIGEPIALGLTCWRTSAPAT